MYIQSLENNLGRSPRAVPLFVQRNLDRLCHRFQSRYLVGHVRVDIHPAVRNEACDVFAGMGVRGRPDDASRRVDPVDTLRAKLPRCHGQVTSDVTDLNHGPAGPCGLQRPSQRIRPLGTMGLVASNCLERQIHADPIGSLGQFLDGVAVTGIDGFEAAFGRDGQLFGVDVDRIDAVCPSL